MNSTTLWYCFPSSSSSILLRATRFRGCYYISAPPQPRNVNQQSNEFEEPQCQFINILVYISRYWCAALQLSIPFSKNDVLSAVQLSRQKGSFCIREAERYSWGSRPLGKRLYKPRWPPYGGTGTLIICIWNLSCAWTLSKKYTTQGSIGLGWIGYHNR